MKPEHVIDETVTLEETSIDAVYEKCIYWLQNMKAKITLRRQNRLEAIYENPSGADDIPTHKLITIQLSETENGVNVRLTIDSDIQKNCLTYHLPRQHGVIGSSRFGRSLGLRLLRIC